MNCLKCYAAITVPICPRCGFSHKEGAVLLGILPEDAYAFRMEIRLSRNPNASELSRLVQYGEQGDREACRGLADYYFRVVENSRLTGIRRDISEYKIARQVSVELTRAAYWCKKLAELKGKLTPGQTYLVALEWMHEGAAAKGFRYLEAAAQAGYRPAIRFLSLCLESGYCCKKDPAAARQWELKLYR